MRAYSLHWWVGDGAWSGIVPGADPRHRPKDFRPPFDPTRDPRRRARSDRRDRLVDSRDSVELDAKLRAAGVAAPRLILPSGSHSTPLAGLARLRPIAGGVSATVAFIDGQREPVAGAEP